MDDIVLILVILVPIVLQNVSTVEDFDWMAMILILAFTISNVSAVFIAATARKNAREQRKKSIIQYLQGGENPAAPGSPISLKKIKSRSLAVR
jgi:hypothetical protein